MKEGSGAGGLKRVFWGWERPVLVSAVQHLTAGWVEGEGLDLGDTLVIVPSMEAGRRLRRALAEWADRRGSAVSVPHVWSPQMALAGQGSESRVAGELEVKAAWLSAVRSVPMNQLKALLPVMPEQMNWRWQWELAGTLTELQELLGAGGLTLADMAGRDGGLPTGERARWRDLARLEAAMEQALTEAGLQNPQAAKRACARRPVLPEAVRRVVVLAAPDLPPLLTVWLRSCAEQGWAVEVVIQAPDTCAAGFDEAGRPLTAMWGEDAEVETGLRGEDIHLAHDPVAQAERVLDWVAESAAEGWPVAVGVCDAEVSPLVREKLEAAGLKVFEPGGESLRQEGLWYLAKCAGELVFDGSWQAFAGLARIPEVRRAWTGDASPEWLKALDDFEARHLPGGIAMAEELVARYVSETREDSEQARLAAGLKTALKGALQWQRMAQRGGRLTEVVREILIALYGERGFRTEAPGDRERLQAGWAWLEECESLETTMESAGLDLPAAELWALVMERLADRRLEATRGEVDLALLGWLELLWEEAPALLVAGFNEENVPGILLGHPFLPDHLRQELGLPCQASRFARDAYVLTALTQQRRTRGRVGVLCGQWSMRGDARRPSRLLTLCPLRELPDRVRQMFTREAGLVGSAEGVRSLAWRLRPERREVRLKTISVSTLKDYLQCPFRFYLKRGLGMRPVSPAGREMDALQFGDLVHRVLRVYAQDKEARKWVHEGQIAAFFEEQVRAAAESVFGSRLPPLVELQVTAAEQRLKELARVEARERQLGWEIVEAELELSERRPSEPGLDEAAAGLPEVTSCLMVAGVPLVGQVDRVERNAHSGRRRIVDFKTTDQPVKPEPDHVDKAGKDGAGEDDWRRVGGGLLGPKGETLLWKNLQLPLYAAALRRHPSGAVDEVAYASLPKAVRQTELLVWTDFNEAWEEAALACAEEAVRRIHAGEFWPPNDRLRWTSDYDFLFTEGAAQSVQWE